MFDRESLQRRTHRKRAKRIEGAPHVVTRASREGLPQFPFSKLRVKLQEVEHKRKGAMGKFPAICLCIKRHVRGFHFFDNPAGAVARNQQRRQWPSARHLCRQYPVQLREVLIRQKHQGSFAEARSVWPM